MFCLNVFFNFVTLIRKHFQCSKLNNYLVSIFLSERVLCLHWNSIVIKPRPNIQSPLKYEYSDVTFFCTFVNIEWFDQLTLVIFMRWYWSRTIWWTALVFHLCELLCVFLSCDLTSWTWAIVTGDNYRSLVTVIMFGSFSTIQKFVIWFTVDIICFALKAQLIYLGILLCKICKYSPVVVTPFQITCIKCWYSYSAKLNTRVILYQFIAPPTQRSRDDLFKWTSDFTFKNGNTASFAGRWTEKRYHWTFVCMSIRN